MEDLEGIGIRVISQSRKELTTNTFDRAGSRLLWTRGISLIRSERMSCRRRMLRLSLLCECYTRLAESTFGAQTGMGGLLHTRNMGSVYV